MHECIRCTTLSGANVPIGVTRLASATRDCESVTTQMLQRTHLGTPCVEARRMARFGTLAGRRQAEFGAEPSNVTDLGVRALARALCNGELPVLGKIWLSRTSVSSEGDARKHWSSVQGICVVSVIVCAQPSPSLRTIGVGSELVMPRPVQSERARNAHHRACGSRREPLYCRALCRTLRVVLAHGCLCSLRRPTVLPRTRCRHSAAPAHRVRSTASGLDCL